MLLNFKSVEVEYDKKLTSTVIKPNATKNMNLDKLKKVINEQSIIQEQSEIDHEDKTTKKEENKNEFSVGIFYYLKDGTKVNNRF